MKKLLPFSLLLTILSCNKKPFIVTYEGSYQGNYAAPPEYGIILFVVAADGRAAGVDSSFYLKKTFPLSGSVTSDGRLTLNIGASSTVGNFTGSILYNIGASGTFQNNTTVPAYSGSWTASKQ